MFSDCLSLRACVLEWRHCCQFLFVYELAVIASGRRRGNGGWADWQRGHGVVADTLVMALHPSGVDESSTSFGWGKCGNVSSAGWQVTLCDPIWHVSPRSGEASC